MKIQRKNTVNNLLLRLEQKVVSSSHKPHWVDDIKQALDQKNNDVNWDLIELDAAVAIA
jgi:hypothetical protein